MPSRGCSRGVIAATLDGIERIGESVEVGLALPADLDVGGDDWTIVRRSPGRSDLVVDFPMWMLASKAWFDADRDSMVVETAGLAQSGAVVALCPSTQANLGDGLFPLHDYLAGDGRIAIGSDSHISINPFEELRWLEYGQRLATHSRNVASLRNSHVGSELFTRALEGGAGAAGQQVYGIDVGAPADLVALCDDDPMLAGHDDDSRLDALVFSGYPLPVEKVMVDGEWREEIRGAGEADDDRPSVLGPDI